MMKAFLNYKDIHPKFKLNGVSYGYDLLKEVAYGLIKDGKHHEQYIGYFLCDWLNENREVEVTTSGATGKPKTITLKKQHMVNSAMATGKFFDLQAGNTALLCLPTAYIAGKMMLVRAMVLGLELDYVAPSSNPMEQVQKNYDFCAMVPLQLQNALNTIDKIKKLIVGGAPLSMQLKKQVQHTATKIFETYGMTETITHVAIKKVNQTPSLSTTGIDNLFKALSGVNFSKDERDCLVIHAPNVASDLVVTNDIIKLISATEFEWLGRFDNVINSGGIKLFPEQIERKIGVLIGCPFFVAGLEDELLGQKLILVVAGEFETDTILEKIKANKDLERFEIPNTIFTLPNFITTGTGKIRRKATLKLLNK